MRVTAETRELTRRKILDAAQELFRTSGFEAATTRDIARTAGIATGTLFNYFDTKEAIVTTLVLESQSRRPKSSSTEQYETLEEALFADVAAEFRLLKPYRKYLTPVLETTLSPFGAGRSDEQGQSLRTNHLEQVFERSRQHGFDGALTPVALQMYWTLYLGVLTFWTNDASPKQEDTLALLDQSLEMFVGWLRASQTKANTTK